MDKNAVLTLDKVYASYFNGLQFDACIINNKKTKVMRLKDERIIINSEKETKYSPWWRGQVEKIKWVEENPVHEAIIRIIEFNRKYNSRVLSEYQHLFKETDNYQSIKPLAASIDEIIELNDELNRQLSGKSGPEINPSYVFEF